MLPLTFSSLAAVLAHGLALAGIAAPALYKPIAPDRLMPGTLSQDIVSLAVAPRFSSSPAGSRARSRIKSRRAHGWPGSGCSATPPTPSASTPLRPW